MLVHKDAAKGLASHEYHGCYSSGSEMRAAVLSQMNRLRWAIHEAYPGQHGKDMVARLKDDLEKENAWLNNGVFLIISQA
jgi:hypothetical protein